MAYKEILDSLVDEQKSLDIGVGGILPWERNCYAGGQWNKNTLPGLRSAAENLDVAVRKITREYRQCYFIDYRILINSDLHLARDGLHLNRNGACTLKLVIQSCLEERSYTYQTHDMPEKASRTTAEPFLPERLMQRSWRVLPQP